MFNVSLHVKRSTDAFDAFAGAYSPMALRTTTWMLINGHIGRPKGSGGSPPG